ncbi:STAS domain-containing protein [Halobacillus sp. A1]|uniref:STAS domain-containing protein n=1 Tax=Halobacillus sp. A1 TaxID=2880262 RepID=UPI0020A654EF|nr:STAS domain-containing protein [Halobacillus sp. A1]MCP3032413.1 STAS domain-containing protein [Halobacillus sp. A1]
MIQQIKRLDREVVVRLSGSIRVDEAADLREKLLIEIEEGYNILKIDFSQVTFLDSAGLGVLVTIYKRVRHRGGALIIQRASNSILELFKLTRLTQVFEFE